MTRLKQTSLVVRGVVFASFLLLASLVLSAGASAHMGSGPSSDPQKEHVINPSLNVAPASAGCRGVKHLPDGNTTVPLTVSRSDQEIEVSVNVCIAGHGPFPFVIDTGSTASYIDAGLAKRLHLSSVGAAQSQGAGSNCNPSVEFVTLPSWSLEGLPLAAGAIEANNLPFSGKGYPDGGLGLGTLARFGSVRIDFDRGLLVFPGPEGPPVTQNESFLGPKGPPPPTSLTNGAGTTVPLLVTTAAGVWVAVHFGGGPVRWLEVDTGSTRSWVTPPVARAEVLTPTDLVEYGATICSDHLKMPMVHTGPWSVSGHALRPQLINAIDFNLPELSGALGADTLGRYGWVVLDFSGGQLVLG